MGATVVTAGGVAISLPKDPNSESIVFNNEWKYGTLDTSSSIPVHTLIGPSGVSIAVTNGVFQNPLNRLDTSGDGRISPNDALLVINHLNKDHLVILQRLRETSTSKAMGLSRQ